MGVAGAPRQESLLGLVQVAQAFGADGVEIAVVRGSTAPKQQEGLDAINAGGVKVSREESER